MEKTSEKNSKQSQFIYKLLGVSNLLEKTTDLEDSLKELASIAAHMLEAKRCSIMLISKAKPQNKNEECYLQVFTHYGNLNPYAYEQMTSINNGIAGYVASTGQPLLTRDISQSAFSAAARYPEQENRSLISVPIIMAQEVVGVINVSGAVHKDSFNQEDLELLKLFAHYAAKSFHISQLQAIIKSRFVEMAVLKELEESSAEESIAVNPDPTRFSKLVAKSFFRELTKAGLGANQIISVSNEVLKLLQERLDKHKKRREED